MAGPIDLGEYGEAFTADPHAVYAELRELGPVHRVRLGPPSAGEGQEAWLVVGYEEARAAFADPRLAKDVSKLGYKGLDVEHIGPHMLMSDPPEHARLRRLVAREFTARRVEALRPRVQQITDDLLDQMVPLGHADLVESLAFPLPMTVICELLGVPDMDRAAFRRLSNEVVAPTSGDAEYAAIVELAAYLDDLIEDKRCTAPADDLLSALIRTTAEDGDRLSREELRAMAYLLLIAGHETTVNLIANGVHALLTHPDQLADLRADMSLLDGAVEEMLRYEGPVENATFRFAAEPLDIGGTFIAQGEAVLVGIAAADRDGDRFPEPDRFDIRRAPQGHLAFGHGIHFCLGAPLARIEARVALRSLLDRCPDLGLDTDRDGPPGPWMPGMLIRGMRRVPVRW
ncbi:cytochrome P450 [Streptomyces sp. PSKA54]|uniref:Cytochrome P450 n=1 Tax=Streptomyces himalayensis subsp. aureolus TaxID=2758039 RepID=A0A7W2D154_9ACTN|nr:cytochrome P450 [Streptomyces himalayensis]MBA4862848.1 cytochrome P450 [Streptomyces himalayensis subsp. aureolus]